MSLIFNTLKLAQGLRGPFTSEQAESLAAALQESTEEAVVTKGDLAEAIANLKTDLVRWIVAAIAFNFFGTAGLFLAFAKVFAK